MTKDRRLGRGLAALLGSPANEHSPVQESQTSQESPDTVPDSSHEAPRPEQNVGLRIHVPDPLDESSNAAETSSSEQPSSEPSSSAQVRPAQTPSTDATDVGGGQRQNGERLLYLDVEAIEENPFQPRRKFSEVEIASLSESLKTHEMLQPILVRVVDGRHQLISGERRLRAAVKAGWKQIPARVREADDRLVAELAIVENLQRKDLNAIEKAMSFKRYLDEHHCKQDDLANRLKIDRSTIANLIRLLELPSDVQDEVAAGRLTAGHARALLPLGEEELQREFAISIRDLAWSVRETERQVQEKIREEDGAAFGRPSAGKSRTRNEQLASLEQELRTALGARAEIRQQSRGRGKIILHFSDHNEFERLFDLLTDSIEGERRRLAG